MKINYYYDADKNIYYERFIGSHIGIEEFASNLLNTKHTDYVLDKENIIVDLKHLTFDEFDKEKYTVFFEKHHEMMRNNTSSFEKFALVIGHINMLPFSNDVKLDIETQQNVRCRYFLDIKDVSNYFATDVSQYFKMSAESLKSFVL